MNSVATIDLVKPTSPSSLSTRSLQFNQESHDEPCRIFSLPAKDVRNLFTSGSTSFMPDPWLAGQRPRDLVVTKKTTKGDLLISDLGWTLEEAIETRLRLRVFEEDWDALGMEIYDEM